MAPTPNSNSHQKQQQSQQHQKGHHLSSPSLGILSPLSAAAGRPHHQHHQQRRHHRAAQQNSIEQQHFVSRPNLNTSVTAAVTTPMMMLNTTVSVEMPVFCFDVIITSLQKRPTPKCPLDIPDKNFPLFITWKKGSHRQLRGCIGTFSRHISLHDSLAEYAQTSAFRDTRFEPITIGEVPVLYCTVSLLICFEPISHYADWVIGMHGVRIDFREPAITTTTTTGGNTSGTGWTTVGGAGHFLRNSIAAASAAAGAGSGRMLNAVYLPEVAHDQGWTQVETLDHLIRKAGYRAQITEQLRLSINVERFQSEKKTISYEEYLIYKKHRQQPQQMVYLQ